MGEGKLDIRLKLAWRLESKIQDYLQRRQLTLLFHEILEHRVRL